MNDNLDIQTTSSKSPGVIDITDAKKKIEKITNSGIWSNSSGIMESYTPYTVGGAVCGYIYAISNRKTWFGYTLFGALLGSTTAFLYNHYLKTQEL